MFETVEKERQLRGDKRMTSTGVGGEGGGWRVKENEMLSDVGRVVISFLDDNVYFFLLRKIGKESESVVKLNVT